MQIQCLQRKLIFVKDQRERILKLKIHWTESMTHLKSRDLLIMKDNNLVPEQREKTGQLGHHRSTSHTKGIWIHDKTDGKDSGWTNISFNRQNDTSFQELRSVNLGGLQNLKTVEKLTAEEEPSAKFALCVSSLNSAQVLDRMESISALLNWC
ncbi:hypothetical protein C1H46_043217 [Malus baccata]|uniref:Uncharacterized protein n=1 Tax=Malus baccata TaxID=106549 RepID=A0A540KAK2_MALBA|nr:hypothetical protein C1H46_043217 [Malus baccata]